MGFLFTLAAAFLPLALLWAIVRYGPIPNRWWRRELPIGFGLFVGAIAFLLGFIGPIVVTPDANQGPLLGIFITGPVGFCVGLVWGLLRAAQRRKAGVS